VSKRVLWSALDRIGLAGPAYRLAERLKAPRARAETGDDGLPLPPPLLMLQVVGHADPQAFHRNGLQCASLVRDLAAEAGVPLATNSRVLDFGCGCGRVLRHLPEVQIVGFDYNPRLVKWVETNLPFAEARTNGLMPPLNATDGEFDLVYAFSVFTHLDQPAQHAWIRELGRVLKPSGLLVFTTKGDRHATEQLDPEGMGRYRAGEVVVTTPGAEGTNLCAAYTPSAWVRSTLLDGWQVTHHHPGRAEVMDYQEIWAARAP